MTKPELTVQKQVEFYNNHDLEGFISTYHKDAELINLTDNSVILKGTENFHKRYKERFEVQKARAEIVNRMVIGNMVIDHEHIKKANSSEIMKAVAIYRVKDGLIEKVWFIFEQ